MGISVTSTVRTFLSCFILLGWPFHFCQHGLLPDVVHAIFRSDVPVSGFSVLKLGLCRLTELAWILSTRTVDPPPPTSDHLPRVFDMFPSFSGSFTVGVGVLGSCTCCSPIPGMIRVFRKPGFLLLEMLFECQELQGLPGVLITSSH